MSPLKLNPNVGNNNVPKMPSSTKSCDSNDRSFSKGIPKDRHCLTNPSYNGFAVLLGYTIVGLYPNNFKCLLATNASPPLFPGPTSYDQKSTAND